jgi:hypothetical protein
MRRLQVPDGDVNSRAPSPSNVLSIDGKIPDDTVKVRAEGHAVQIRIAIMRRLFSKWSPIHGEVGPILTPIPLS